MIENGSLWENPFFFILVFFVFIAVSFWIVRYFDILCRRSTLIDIRKCAKEKHDALYCPLNKLHLMEVR